MKAKKLLFSLGAMAVVAAPVISVVSCGSKSSVENIDLSQVKSVKDLFAQINKKINIAMPKSAVKLAAPNSSTGGEPVLTDDQVKQITTYMAGIQDAKINIAYKGKSVTIDFQLKQFTQVVLKSLANMPKAADQQANLNKRIIETMDSKNKNPNIVAYIGKSAQTVGMEMAGFMALDDAGWNAYNAELKSITSTLSSLVSSDFYKDWAKDKQYTLLSIDTPISGGGDTGDGLDPSGQVLPEDTSITPPHINIVKYTSGQTGSYDDHGATAPKFSIPAPSDPDKTSNLEAEFALRLCDLLPSDY